MVGLSNVLGTLTPKHIHLLANVFVQLYLEERWGMDVQARGNILHANTDK